MKNYHKKINCFPHNRNEKYKNLYLQKKSTFEQLLQTNKKYHLPHTRVKDINFQILLYKEIMQNLCKTLYITGKFPNTELSSA